MIGGGGSWIIGFDILGTMFSSGEKKLATFLKIGGPLNKGRP